MTKNKRLYYCLLMGLFLILPMYGQETISVSGQVTSAEDGMLIPGVNVLVKGTSTGAVTDFNGTFTITTSPDAVLVFSYVGFETMEIPVNGRTEINVSLSTGSNQLSEVVVTALGIKREEKTLTYANTEVDSEILSRGVTTNFASNLSGRVAGLEITQSSSGAGGSTKMILRGSKSLSGGSEPLIVIDGIPMANNTGGQPGMWGGSDKGDGLSQINQDDIASLTILKGASAAVLYGSDGANGVVLITTKSGQAGTTKVTINSGITFETVTGIPDMQFRYGAEGGTKESWSYTPGDYDDAFVEDFFETGVNYVNNISISGGNEITTAYLSFSNVMASGVMPTNDYLKNNATFKTTTKLFDEKLTVGSLAMLTYEKTENPPPAGYYLNPLTGLYFFPRNLDFDQYKDYQYFDAVRNMYLQNWHVVDHHSSNPFWILNKEPREDHTQRVIANIDIAYHINEHLNFKVRGNIDYASNTFEQRHAAGSNATNVHKNGRWEYSKYSDQLLYTDALLTYDNDFGDFDLMAVAGASYKKTVFGKGVSVDNGTDPLLYPNEFSFQNLGFNVQVQSIFGSRVVKQGVFLTTNVGYKDMVYLNLAGRQDWASTLAGTGNESYFYPAVGLSVLLNEMFEMPEFISFGKIRGSYSVVANEVPFNVVDPGNTITAGGGIALNTTQPFSNLEPEEISSSEIGLDWKFLQNRLGLDFTYYHISSTNQFIALPAPSGSQYTTYYVNAGEIVNKGIEFSLYATPVQTENFNWQTSFNYAANENEIVELHPDLTEPITLGNSEGYTSKIVPGGSIGDIYVFKFQRDAEGRIMLEDGVPLRTATSEFVGNAEPDWSMGWSNAFNYKNFRLTMLVNGKFGGVVVSQTESMLDGYGVSERSAVARDNGGVTINGVQDGQPVTTVDAEDWFTTVGGRNGIKEAYVYDRTNVRLSQVALSYLFDVGSTEVSVSAVGQNLFFFYKDAPYDPELAMSTGRSFQGLDNFNMPGTASYGFSLNLTF